MTFNWLEEWNISFAGCGFRSIYYVGALSCILERAPHLVDGASKICGASSGCLVAAALTVGIPIEQLCANILTTASEARKHSLRVFHPTFSLLRTVRDSLLEELPQDAHRRASGRLCVSLTRMSDMKNVLVSEFDTREELIQVLMCSCFFPAYSGFIPPSYRGVRYMDGALSNNVPLCEQRNTIIMAPFSGESDICPREGTYNALEVHYGNVSIKVNTGNVHRICTSFLPPRLEMLAEICNNGYVDALCFLRERGLLRAQNAPHAVAGGKCCELGKKRARTEEQTKKKILLKGNDSDEEDHQWLDPEVIQNLPGSIQQVLCAACRNSHDGVACWSQLIDPVKLIMFLLSLLILPVQMTVLVTKRLLMSADLHRQTRRTRGLISVCPEQDCSSGFSDCTTETGGDSNSQRAKERRKQKKTV
ncbi:patatin-like phospholipase domain-containing protein 2 [Salarias fasciatus]|uniref:patatin-like phospholipase domain-containing protein 2 n=1 Tax=Salarias fasciatus TaxID=181472 RepID=UPI001176CEBA|nr:patatin-like phospholipase domain-containing protein 2 [Salarias fasciatus]